MDERCTDEELQEIVAAEDYTLADPRALIAEVIEQRARVAELEAAERSAELETADRIAGEFGIHSLSAQDGTATLTTVPTTEQARRLVLAMSLACGRMLDDDQAPNYVEFEVSPAGQPGYVVHVRRAGGPSPHTLRREAEARAERAEVRVAELEASERLGFVTGYRADGEWYIEFDGDLFTWDEAIEDLHSATAEVPDVAWHVLEVRRPAGEAASNV